MTAPTATIPMLTPTHVPTQFALQFVVVGTLMLLIRFSPDIDETGVDETDVDETGVDETGVDETDVDETGVDEAEVYSVKVDIEVGETCEVTTLVETAFDWVDG